MGGFMRYLLLLFALLITAPAIAQREISSQIHDIDMGQINEEPLIFLTTGQVMTYPLRNKQTMSYLKEAIKRKTWFTFTVNLEREIIDLKEIPSPEMSEKKLNIFQIAEPYTPSILKNMDQARSFFYSARTDAKQDSQCFNRAHVWSYEWRTKRNLYSSKAWIFFTRRYIRKYKFEWWFHIAPMVHVVDEGQVRERIMDIKYSRGPLKLKQWTNIFMRDGADCPVVQKYTDQANHPESGSCFIIKSNMYHYQPVDLEQEEITGQKKMRWLEPEVRHAYKEAFDIDLNGGSHE
jgi:hypothetical protein